MITLRNHMLCANCSITAASTLKTERKKDRSNHLDLIFQMNLNIRKSKTIKIIVRKKKLKLLTRSLKSHLQT